MKRRLVLGGLLMAGALSIAVAAQQQAPPKPSASAIKVEKLSDNLYILNALAAGSGGNTSIFITATGVVVVDTKNPGWGQPLLDKIKTLTNKPVTTIVNTHTHGDHVSGNVEFPASVDVVVQENTKANMTRMDAFKGDKAQFLPKRTYKDTLTIGAGKDQIDLYYFGPGHTNGDTFVVYRALDVMHAGDMFPWKDAPFIDRSNGGSGRQWPLSLKKALDTVKNVQSVIGGHQPVATWKDFATFQQFTAELWSQTEAAQKAGKSVDEAAASTGWLSKYPGYDSTRLKAAVQAIYDELSGK